MEIPTTIIPSTSAKRWTFLAFGAPLLSAVGLAQQSPTFSVQVLGNITGGITTYASGINEAGDVVGGAGEGSSVCPYDCAVIWHDGTPTLLVVEGANRSGAVAMEASSTGLA